MRKSLSLSFLAVASLAFVAILFRSFVLRRKVTKAKKSWPRYVYNRPTFSHRLAALAGSVSMTARNGRKFVIVTTGTYAYREYISNMACSLKRLGNHSVLLLALDRALYTSKLPGNVHPFLFKNITQNEFIDYGTSDFNDLSRLKLDAAAAVLATGIDILFLDSDVVWCSHEAAENIANTARGHVTFQYAAVKNHFANTGLYYARTSEESLKLLIAARAKQGHTEQHSMNDISCAAGVKVFTDLGPWSTRRWPPDFCVWDRTTTLGLITPIQRYPLGCTEIAGKELRRTDSNKIRDLCSSKKIGLIHYSCFKNKEKKANMERHGTWFVDADSGLCKFADDTKVMT